MKNTVVVLEAGIGAMAMGFENAGFHVIAAYEKDKKAIEIYRNNVNEKIYFADMLELQPESIPDADVLAGNLSEVLSVNIANRKVSGGDYLTKLQKILRCKNPSAFCFMLKKAMIKSDLFFAFLMQIAEAGYSYRYQCIDTQKITGIPITESHLYLVGTRSSVEKEIEFPMYDSETVYPLKEFFDSEEKDAWYYRVKHNQIEENGKEDTFLCWRSNGYTERPLAGWNLLKMPLVRIDGVVRKITPNEIARLKGFPKGFSFETSNREWLYRKLVYSPNMRVVELLARSISRVFAENPLHKLQAANEQIMKELFGRYLEKKRTDVRRWENGFRGNVDYTYTCENLEVYVEVKFYNSDFSLESKLQHTCEKLETIHKKTAALLILAVGNLVNNSVKDECKERYGVHIWDVRNLLWIFDEFQDIKNEFIALLNYTVDNIEPEVPVPFVFAEKKEPSPEDIWKKKLLSVKAGREHFREYENTCTEILKYILGDYLTLWEQQEESNDGLYRFDLCCKIKSGVDQDFFDTVKNYFNTKYIVFEFKNYSRKITQKEIYTTEKYLYEKALRRVAIIISRMGADTNALAAARGCLRENGKLILCLSDNDLMELIDIKNKNEQSTAEFFEAMLDDLLIHLEK